MDLHRDNVRAVYRKYFLAAFGSALISCIYGVVDMAMVGQYQRPDGAAALVSCAAFSVFWTALSLAWPNLYIRIFMRPTAAILTMAPGIVRTYAVSFLLLPAVLGPASIWWAMPVTELLVACCAAAAMRRATRALPSC